MKEKHDPSFAICPYPFSRLQLNERREYIPCCKTWLTDEYHKLDPGDDFWNGPAAQELRRRILDGDYSLCHRASCGIPLRTLAELKENPFIHREAPVDPVNLEAITNKETFMPNGPPSIIIAADNRCNLACPSCRHKHIFKLNRKEQALVSKTERFLRKNRKSIRVVYIAERGESFFSPWLRTKIKEFSKDNFPALDHLSVLTNGTLMNSRTFEELLPGSENIRKITVSVDAGSEETYAKVRGGDWNKLMQNLRWVAQERKKGRFECLSINYVVRKENFRDIPKIVELVNELDLDFIFFITFATWGVFLRGTPFEPQAVHLADHPDHPELLDLCRPHLGDPKVHFQFPGGRELQENFRNSLKIH